VPVVCTIDVLGPIDPRRPRRSSMADDAALATRPEILWLPEVAEYLRISRAQAYALARRGIIPSFQIGGSRRVRRCDLETFIASQLE